MKKIIILSCLISLALLILGSFAAGGASAKTSEFRATAYPTITPYVPPEVNVWIPVSFIIADRGKYGGVVRTATIRDTPSIFGKALGNLYPGTVVSCDYAKQIGADVWCRMSAQGGYRGDVEYEWWTALYYNGTWFTDWRP